MNAELRRIQVADTVFRMLGIWTLMGSYFGPLCAPFAEILAAGKASGGETLSNLIEKSCLLPNPKEVDSRGTKNVSTSMRDTAFSVHTSLASMESLSIDFRRLNAYRLSTFARTDIHWTTNISRHMLLSQHAGRNYLELFALPCTLEGRPEEALSKIGLSPSLAYEIRDSYAALFNPEISSTFHRTVLRWLGASWWCWCLSCSSRRLFGRQLKTLKASTTVGHQLGESLDPGFDPMLATLAGKRAPLWSQTRFRNLWPRITALDAHLQKVRPWGFWVLFRDRRDTLQFWTFLFGTLILMLTRVQVALGIAQVVGTF